MRLTPTKHRPCPVSGPISTPHLRGLAPLRASSPAPLKDGLPPRPPPRPLPPPPLSPPPPPLRLSVNLGLWPLWPSFSMSSSP